MGTVRYSANAASKKRNHTACIRKYIIQVWLITTHPSARLTSFSLHSSTRLWFASLSLYMAPGFERASSEHSVGAHSSRCPATMSWNYAPRGCTRRAKAACTRCHEWIPPWWLFTTPPRATAVPVAALGGSTPCPRGRGATSRLATPRSPAATVALRRHKTEVPQALNPWSSLKEHFHRSACDIIHTHTDMCM